MLRKLKQYFRLKKLKIVLEKKVIINKNVIFEGNNKIGKRSYISNCYFGKYSYIGEDCKLRNIRIGRYCSLGENVKGILGMHPIDFIGTHPIFYEDNDKFNCTKKAKKWEIIIEDDVWIGDNVSILSGVRIGHGAIIGANALVTKDVDEFSIVAGNPAKVIKYRFTKELCKAIKKIEWWMLDSSELKKYKKYFHNPEVFIQKIKENKI